MSVENLLAYAEKHHIKDELVGRIESSLGDIDRRFGNSLYLSINDKYSFSMDETFEYCVLRKPKMHLLMSTKLPQLGGFGNFKDKHYEGHITIPKLSNNFLKELKQRIKKTNFHSIQSYNDILEGSVLINEEKRRYDDFPFEDFLNIDLLLPPPKGMGPDLPPLQYYEFKRIELCKSAKSLYKKIPPIFHKIKNLSEKIKAKSEIIRKRELIDFKALNEFKKDIELYEDYRFRIRRIFLQDVKGLNIFFWSSIYDKIIDFSENLINIISPFPYYKR